MKIHEQLLQMEQSDMADIEPEDAIHALQTGKLKEWSKGDPLAFRDYLTSNHGFPVAAFLFNKTITSRPANLGEKVEVDSETATTMLRCNWDGFCFKNCSFSLMHSFQRFINCSFENCQFGPENDLHENASGVTGIQLDNCDSISECSFTNCTVVIADKSLFRRCEFVGETFSDWRCSESKFESSNFSAPLLNRSLFEEVSFERCRFKVDTIAQVDWRQVSFRKSSMMMRTVFAECQFNKISVDDRFLESLGHGRGGLGSSELAIFQIISPVTELRLLFGGWKASVHWIAFMLFVIPYLIFTVQKFWGPLPSFDASKLDVGGLLGDEPDNEAAPTANEEDSKQRDDEKAGSKKIIFGEALWYFICYGNHAKESQSCGLATYRVSTFILFLMYNACRLTFLLKVKTLEYTHAVQGFWPRFEFSDPVHPKLLRLNWGTFRTAADLGTVLAVLCGVSHFVEVLFIPVLP